MGHTPVNRQPSTMGDRSRDQSPGWHVGSDGRHGHRLVDHGDQIARSMWRVSTMARASGMYSPWPVQLVHILGEWTGGTTTWA